MADSKPNAVDPAGALFDVKGLVVVITGGGSGIGQMYATTLENNGAIVYIVGRRLEVLEKTAQECSRFGNIIPAQGDITDHVSLKALVQKIESERGYINLLINNAGILHNRIPKVLPTDIKELQSVLWNSGTPEEFDSMFEVNVKAPYYTTIAFMHLLHEGNKHSIPRGISSQVITVSSIGGLRRGAKTASIAYGVSKAAAIHLGKSFTNLLSPHRIRSNIICPGVFPSDMAIAAGVITPELLKLIPENRLGVLEDMGGLILFMASKAGSYHNGAVQVIDGGWLSTMPSVW